MQVLLPTDRLRRILSIQSTLRLVSIHNKNQTNDKMGDSMSNAKKDELE